MLRSWRTSRFSPTFLRNATAFGVSPRLRFDLVLNNLVAWAYSTGRVLIKSDGTPWRPIVHIEDISRAFLAVLEAPVEAVHNEAFNVGRNEDNYRVRELAANREGNGAGNGNRVCGRCRSRQALLPRGLQQDTTCVTRIPARLGCAARGTRALQHLPADRAGSGGFRRNAVQTYRAYQGSDRRGCDGREPALARPRTRVGPEIREEVGAV